MNEAQYQTKLIKKLHNLFPDCIILKNDAAYMPGIPDILILFHDRWAMLEVKLSDRTGLQPNQEWYVEVLNEMSFASFINPQNEEDVLYALQHSFGFDGASRIS